jgi:hypothetical protein
MFNLLDLLMELINFYKTIRLDLPIEISTKDEELHKHKLFFKFMFFLNISIFY